MKKYKYTAVNKEGKKFQGVFLAESEKDLRTQLAKQDLYLVSAKQQSEKSPNSFFSLTGKVSVNELSTFCRQFSILITSGTSIVDALAILKGQSYAGYFKKILERVYEDVKSGVLLSDAMSKHKKVFPNFLRSMIRVGEVSGSIDNVLVSVADYFESDSKMKSKLRSALVYPCILLVMALAIIVLMVVYIIPTFENSLSAMDVEMPVITQVIMNISDFFVANWLYVFLGVVAVCVLWILFLRTKKGRYFWDKAKFHMPVVGKVVKSAIAARFCSAFSLLVGGGMDIVDAMDEVTVVFGNVYVASQFKKATDDVRRGVTITDALNAYKIFPVMVVQMVAVGERTGELAAVLRRSVSFFENQLERSISSATSLIQPVILVIIGATVGVLFYAIYSPMLSIMNTL